MKRTIIKYIAGNIILAFGISFTQKAALGISPPLCIALVSSEILNITYGLAIFFVYFAYLVLQIIISKKIDKNTILQIPFAYVFSMLVDFINMIITIQSDNIFISFIILFLAIIFTGFGCALVLDTPYIKTPTDSFVATLSSKFSISSGTAKMIFDISCVTVCFIIGILSNRFLHGLGIGTMISMFCVGTVVKLVNKYVLRKVKK